MLTFSEYQDTVSKTDPFEKNFKGDMGVLLSIASEAGEVLEVEKKRIRDCGQFEKAQKEKFEELGDVLWGLAVYAGRIGFSLEDIAQHNIKRALKKTEERQKILKYKDDELIEV